MKISKVSEVEIDLRLKLDKRRDPRAFCRCFDSLDEAPVGFYDLQNEIRKELDKIFWTNFDDHIDRSHFASWEPGAMHTLFCFNTDMIGADQIVVEIVDKILGDKLVGVILAYLEEQAFSYCVIAVVYKEMINGKNYIGRVVINLNEIAVEESLFHVWSDQVRIMEVEN